VSDGHAAEKLEWTFGSCHVNKLLEGSCVSC
jgi:hypothetical protein